MQSAKPPNFMRQADGIWLQRQADGSYAPATPLTDRARLASLTDDEIEQMGADDPDHPALDDAFWSSVEDRPNSKVAISIELDADILSHFRRRGQGYQTRINAVLRRYVDARRKDHG